MKKLTILFAAIALVCFAVPAMAVDWNFYGSARIFTFFVSTDLGDGQNAAGNSKDSELAWGNTIGNNSRLGARVKAENVSGRVEIQLKGNSDGDPGNYVSTETRLAYGEWKFGDGMSLKVGKDYTPVSQFVSGMTFDEDLGLLGMGAQYGNRTPQIALSFGGFNIALIQPKTDYIAGTGATAAKTSTVTTAGITYVTQTAAAKAANGDPDSYLPKIEASFGMGFDTWNFGLQGGYQYYSISDVVSGTTGKKNDIGVTSYTIGGNAGFNFGPAYAKASIAYGQNWGDAAWGLNGGWTHGSNAYWDGDDSTDDTTSLMGTLEGGLKVSDMLSFEAGFGYRQDDYDVKGYDKDKFWATYLQAVVVLAPGVYLVPEVGYYDYMDNYLGKDEGDKFYLGTKWQIDF
jgi:hypothetical protein